MTVTSNGFGQSVVDGMILKSTDDAILYLIDHLGDERWIPRKVCLDGGNLDDGDTDIAVADWWLKQERIK